MRAMSLLLTIALLAIAQCVSGQQPIPISEAEKEEIVRAHNLLRSQVEPPATNMEIMVGLHWNNNNILISRLSACL